MCLMQTAAAAPTTLSIGALAKRAGTKVQTIRYYEQIGLIPAPERTAGNQRVYGPVQVRRLAFIRHGRELGFGLEAIRQLLAFSDDPRRSCVEADRIARQQLDAVESRIARLAALAQELRRMIRQCRCSTVADCRVIEVLADHSHAKCLRPDHGDVMGEAHPRA
jgi:DNA-binding transcriptional MerR regulator